MALNDSLEQLISLWAKFPGIGEKTARRMVFFMLGQNKDWVRSFASSIVDLRDTIRACDICGALTVADPCAICRDQLRDRTRICVVETQEDCVAMEQSGIYNGLYHVLGGGFSPLDDEELPAENLEKLRERVENDGTREVILALDPRIEGDLTAYAVQDALEGVSVLITRLAYGLPVGGSIGFADFATLHVAMESRREMEGHS